VKSTEELEDRQVSQVGLCYGSAEADGTTLVGTSGCFCALAALMLGFALQLGHGEYDRKALIAVVIAVGSSALAIVGPKATVALPFSRKTAIRGAFLFTLSVYLVIGFVNLHLRPATIDVFHFESDATRSFTRGEDPYRVHFMHYDFGHGKNQYYYGPGFAVDGGVEVGFPYPPLTLLWMLPGYLAGDVRYSFLIAVVLTALLVFRMAPDLNGLAAALLLMFVPETLFVLTYAWTEPLMLLALAGSVFCAMRFPKLLPLALGLFFASKQYSVIFVPITALLVPNLSWKGYLKLLVKAGSIAAVTLLPFALWNVHGLWRSLVIFQMVAPFRTDSLSFSNLFVRHGFHAIPQWGVLVAIAATNWFALKKATHTPAGFAVAVALVSLVFFVLNKQAFCNYYFFSAGALCIGLSSEARDSNGTGFALVRLPLGSAAGLIVSKTENSRNVIVCLG
jgi:hypothetical protein